MKMRQHQFPESLKLKVQSRGPDRTIGECGSTEGGKAGFRRAKKQSRIAQNILKARPWCYNGWFHNELAKT